MESVLFGPCLLGWIHELDSLLDGFIGGKLRALFQELRTFLIPPFLVSQVLSSHVELGELETLRDKKHLAGQWIHAKIQQRAKVNLIPSRGVQALRAESPEAFQREGVP